MTAGLSINRVMVDYELASDDVGGINRNIVMMIMMATASFGDFMSCSNTYTC